MKKILLILIVLFSLPKINAQAPSQFKYQAVLRDASGNILANQAVTVDISILQGSTTGTSVFTETHNTTTTAQGLINLNIGSENDMSTVDWSADSYFVSISVNGDLMGTSQLLSVPYALQAKKADNYDETDPVFTAWDKSSGISITESQISNLQHFTNADETDPLFSGWDKNYADLTNKPGIIDSITTVIDTTTQFVRKNTQWIKNGNDLYYENGLIGIGTTNPLGKLHIAGADNTHRVYIEGSGVTANLWNTSGSFNISTETAHDIRFFPGTSQESLTLKMDGNVGIGTSNPTNKLEISGTPSGHYGISVMDDGLGRGMQIIAPDFSYLSTGNSVQIGVTSGTSEAAYLQSSKNGKSEPNYLIFNPQGGNVGIGSPATNAKLYIDNTTSNMAWSMIVASGNNSGLLVDGNGNIPLTNRVMQVSNGAHTEMVILGNGNMGLGTISPANLLDIEVNGQNGKGINFSNSGTELGHIVFGVGGTMSLNATLDYRLNINDTEKIRIDNNGNVGIGTSAPQAPLHVNGFMKLEPRATAPSSPTEGTIYYDNADHELKVFDGATWLGQKPKHYVGELYGGGIVFYVYDNGQHGLIASLDDLNANTGVAWSGDVSTEIGAAARSMTDGVNNTAAIIAQDATPNKAATLCDSYAGGGFTDWYLPSNRELYLLCSQDLLINQILNNDGDATTNGFTQEHTSPTYGRYWSSTEYSNNNVWAYDFGTGSSYGGSYKGYNYNVRAIRSF